MSVQLSRFMIHCPASYLPEPGEESPPRGAESATIEAADDPASPGTKYAERLFPAPIDHGIAQDDRAVSTVESGVDTARVGAWQNDLWYQGGGRIGEKAVESIVIYPPTRGVDDPGRSRSSR